MQPYLLQLYGSSHAYAVAGLAAAIVAGAQIVGGLAVPYLRLVFRRRTTLLLAGTVASAAALALIGLRVDFWIALAALAVWAIVFAASIPVRLAFINGLIPSAERATVLSFDNLLGSAGGAVAQPALGKVADVWGYPASYLAGAFVDLAALPLLLLARRERASSDPIEATGARAGSA
jgi:MFS family permease